MGISPYRHFLEPSRPRMFRLARHTRAQSAFLTKLVREWKSQGPEVQKKGGTIIERQMRRVRDKLDIGWFCRSDQYRSTTGIQGAFHVDRGVADIPDVRAGGDPAALKRHSNRCRIRLVG